MKTLRHIEVILLFVGFFATVAIVTYGWCNVHSGKHITPHDIFVNLKAVEWLWITVVSLTLILTFAVIVQTLGSKDCLITHYRPFLVYSANSTIAVSLLILGISLLQKRNPNIQGLSVLRDPPKYLTVGAIVALAGYILSMVSEIRFGTQETRKHTEDRH